VVLIWKRIKSEEHDEKPRKWQHKDSGDEVEIEKYSNNTWDTKHNGRLIENFDTVEEALERGKKLIGES